MEYQEHIESLIASYCSLFYLGTPNQKVVLRRCMELGSRYSMEIHRYNISDGLWVNSGRERRNTSIDPIEMLNRIIQMNNHHSGNKRRLILLEHFDLLLESQDPVILTKLRIINDSSCHRQTVILIGACGIRLPEIIGDIPKVLTYTLEPEDIHEILDSCQTDLDEYERKILAGSLKGLSALECENVISLSLAKEKKLDHEFIDREKALLITQKAEGLIELCKPDIDLEKVGGLDILKKWLKRREPFFRGTIAESNKGIPSPKGIILTGLPGCGKSFLAEALAGSWGVNLARLNISRILSSLVGQTEKNFSTALETIKALKPIVLLIDEFEKFFPYAAGSQSDGGVLSRLLGMFLDFLHGQRDGVFCCATTNAIHDLPAEIMRPGRFDAVWFVDIPSREERGAILDLLMEKYGLENQIYIDDIIIDATADFSGSELEQAVIEALYQSSGGSKKINMFEFLGIVREVVPMAKGMEEKISSFREYCSSRTRFASSPEIVAGKERRSMQCPISLK